MRFVAPVIAVLWGGGIVVRFIATGTDSGSSGYATGQLLAVAFGVVLVVAGVVSLRRRLAESE